MFGGSTTSALRKLCASVEDKYDLVTMTVSFAAALVHRRRFHHFARLVQDPRQDFNAEEEWSEIFRANDVSDIVADNVRRCLEAIRLTNKVIQVIFVMKTQIFDVDSSDHMQILNEFWSGMKNNRQRSNPKGFISADWIELGFQNADPTTDFRGMGVLGLVQLHYFSQHRPQRAKFILQNLSDPKKYYPFAIIGINITSFVIELIHELRMQKILLENLAHTVAADLTKYEILPSDDAVCVNFGVNVVHDFYCLIFEEFYLQWVIMNPDNIMSFNRIFDEVKRSIRKKYEAL